LITVPGCSAVIGRVEIASDGAGWATVPGADQETVTSWAGLLPQVSSSCSGAVVVGSGTVVVGDRSGRWPRARAAGGRSSRRAQ
jgi:outer membrane protein assembly factor BamB